MNDMKSKLGIDFNQVEHARDVARKIANGVQDFVEGYTTVAVERTLCRLIGIDGVDANAVPLPNVVVEELREKNVLGEGALFFLGNAIVETGLTPQQSPSRSLPANSTSPARPYVRQPSAKRR